MVSILAKKVLLGLWGLGMNKFSFCDDTSVASACFTAGNRFLSFLIMAPLGWEGQAVESLIYRVPSGEVKDDGEGESCQPLAHTGLKACNSQLL